MSGFAVFVSLSTKSGRNTMRQTVKKVPDEICQEQKAETHEHLWLSLSNLTILLVSMS